MCTSRTGTGIIQVCRFTTVHVTDADKSIEGGMTKAISMISSARGSRPAVIADLHEDRPYMRGMQPSDSGPVPWDSDPSFEEIEQAGARIAKNVDVHTVLDGMFLISGEILRITDYELGLPAGIRFNPVSGAWEKDTQIRDERYVVCRLKGL